jgi:hypothetical protein
MLRSAKERGCLGCHYMNEDIISEMGYEYDMDVA